MESILGALRSASFGMLDSASSGGRTYFPVNPNVYLYSQFKYVGGTPSDDGGIPITKLKILDTIIDQLITMRRITGVDADSDELQLLGGGATDAEIEKKIALYQQEVQALAENMQNPFYGFLVPEAGLLFNIQA